MGSCADFLFLLDPDMSFKILTCLDDPADLVRVSCVSRSWRHYVVANGLCKQLCLKMFPQLSRVACVVELNAHGAKQPAEVGSSYSMELHALESEHRVYTYFARASTASAIEDCISEAISASSTDNYPEESIVHTLESRDRVEGRASYWSSKGQSNPSVPETLIYKLASDICVITEINLHPFQAFFQLGFPIYSAKSVRFRMGHSMLPLDGSDDEKFIWSYTSPEFPMVQRGLSSWDSFLERILDEQESRLQEFKLPEPVLCIGGILQIELLGRVQRQEMDGLFYICISHVQVRGRLLSPAFSFQILDPSGNFVLKSDHLANKSHAVPTDYVQRRLRDFQQIVTMLRENVVGVVEDDWDEEDEEMDELEEDYAL